MSVQIQTNTLTIRILNIQMLELKLIATAILKHLDFLRLRHGLFIQQQSEEAIPHILQTNVGMLRLDG